MGRGELGIGTQAQDLLRIFQNKVNEKIQKVYRACKAGQLAKNQIKKIHYSVLAIAYFPR